ncbi:MAG: arylsulfatase A-like enzyme [Verrucomicrobiales bacterium]|jgi:arylsulfatase A-like enzyme
MVGPMVGSAMLKRLLFCIAWVGAVQMLEAAERPNIVFLLSDDQTTYSLGCYGNEDVQTPHLDALAADGVAFDRHYNTTAICMASRANIMTGMFEYKTGCNFEHGPLLRPHWEKSYPILLRKAGYRTAIAGKFGFVVADKVGDKGMLPEKEFDRWGGGPGQTEYATRKNLSMAAYAKEYPHSTLSYGAFGADFIKDEAKQESPFCLSISFKAPHRPVTPDPKFASVYANKKFKKPANYGRQYGEHFASQSKQGRQYERFISWDYDKDYDGVMARYHQQIYAIDVAVGMIRQALEDAGVADNTVIVFTSDNGFFCGSHGYGSKVLPYEESSRAPLIVFDPRSGLPGGRRSSALTGNVDIAPTLLDLAGLPQLPNMDGLSLMTSYQDTVAPLHDFLPLINVWGPRACHSLSVVTQTHKYIYWEYSEDGFTPTEEVYNLAADPLELSNIAGSATPSQTAALRKTYDSAVAHWKEQSVDYHRYKQYAEIFARPVNGVQTPPE